MKFKFETLFTLIIAVTVGLLLYIYFNFSKDFEIVLYKFSVVTLGALSGFIIDLALFKSGGELQDQTSELCRAAVLLRRGFIVSILALAMSGAM